MNDLRLAVVGLNFGIKHAQNILSDSVDGRLVAVCDLDPSYRDFAEAAGVSFYQDYRQLLEKEKIDGAVIAVPPHKHSEIGVEFALRGVHLFVEKPITSTLQEADELIDAACGNGLCLLVGHMQRFDPNVERAKEMIQAGELGGIVGFQMTSAMVKSPSYFRQSWKHSRATAGGPFVSNGVHDVDRLRYLCGDVACVSGFMSNAYRGYEVENSAAVSFEMKNGAVGTYLLTDCGQTFFEYTDMYYGPEVSIAFNCSSMASTRHKHLFEKVSWKPVEKGHYERRKEIELIESPVVDCHLAEMQHFCRVIRDGEEPRTSGEDAKESLRLLLAVLEAGVQRKTVHLE
jgi:predicted dehydrogenase